MWESGFVWDVQFEGERENLSFFCAFQHTESGAAAVEGLLPAGWDAIKNVQYAQCSRKAFCE